MKVLLLTQFYWPERRTAPFNLATIAESLQDRGHEVLVLTGFPNHPFGRLYDGYRMRWRQWDEVRGVRVLRLPLYPSHSLSGLKRALHYGSFALSSATIGAWLSRRFEADVLFVYLPPLTNWLPIRVLKALHGVPAMYWITDLWPEALQAAGARIPPWLARAIQRLDTAVSRQARLICVNSPGLKELLLGKGVAEDKVEVITDWADEELFFPVPPDPDLARQHGLDGKFNVMYGGTIGPAQGLDTVLGAAELLRGQADLQFVLVGSGEDKERLRRLAGERGLDNVLFLPGQPMDQIHRFYALADVLLAHLSPDPLYEVQIPSKIMAYMACGRPILCAIAGAAAAVVEPSGAGICCPPGDPQAMAAAIRRLAALSRDERERLGAAGREAYLGQYTRAVQAARIEGLLRGVAAARKAA